MMIAWRALQCGQVLADLEGTLYPLIMSSPDLVLFPATVTVMCTCPVLTPTPCTRTRLILSFLCSLCKEESVRQMMAYIAEAPPAGASDERVFK